MTVPTHKGFYSAATKPPIPPWRCGVRKPSTQPRWRLSFGHEDADSEGLLLGCSEVSDSAITMRNQNAFYLAAATSSIRPWGSRVVKASTRQCWRLRFGHDDADSERLLLGRSEVSDFAMMMHSYKAFYSAPGKSLTPPWKCEVGKPSTRSQWCLQFIHDDADLKRLLLGRNEVSDVAMTMRSRKTFHSAAVTPSIRPSQSQVVKTSTRSQRSSYSAMKKPSRQGLY